MTRPKAWIPRCRTTLLEASREVAVTFLFVSDIATSIDS